MSLLDVGGKCTTCGVVDFLPFTCGHCAGVFCKEHVHAHGCVEVETSKTSRKRAKGICAVGGCTSETIESIGGLDLENASEGDIARQVRCTCGGAFCPAHRSQEAHNCTAPRELSARNDAGLARRAHAQEVLAQTMPDQSGKERLTMPKQVDRTRVAPVESNRLPPSVIAEREREAAKKAESTSQETASTALATDSATTPATESTIPPTSSASPATSTWTDTPAYAKLHKMHCMKIRSLAKPLDVRAPRDKSSAVEWTVGNGTVRDWAPTGSFKLDSVAAAFGERKPERIWVPDTMPAGKLFDTLVARAKLRADGLTLFRVSLTPGPLVPPAPLDLSLPAGQQLAHGDVLVLVS